MIVELANFRSDFTNLPPFQTVLRIQNLPVLLLELPQFRINVEGPPEIRLPLFMTILRKIPAKELLKLV